MAEVENTRFDCIFAINRAVEYFKRREKTYAAPFVIMYWSTDKIKYDCKFCYRGDRLNTNDVPFYCAHSEILNNYAIYGAKPVNCINCDLYKSR